MADHGSISARVAEQLAVEPLVVQPSARNPLSDLAPHFAEHVRREASLWARGHQLDLYRDGLRIHTTLDPYLQRHAADAVARRLPELEASAGLEWAAAGVPFGAFWRQHSAFEEQLIRSTGRYRSLLRNGMTPPDALRRLQALPAFVDSLRSASTRLETGMVALDPHTGHVKAWVGSRDFFRDQFDKVASARRQPGSTFKPFLYAAALEVGYSPYHFAEDVQRTYVVPPYGELWSPQNSGGSASGQLLTLRQALARSKNTVSARLIQQVGPTRVVRLAQRAGISSTLLAVPSLALGTSEVTLLELVSAYGSFAADGVHHPVIAITRIEDSDGRILTRFTPDPTPVVSPDDAYTVIDMLRDVLRPGGTAGTLESAYTVPGDWVGKTGTTQNNSDGWFVALHPRLAVGAWVGFNYPSIRFRSTARGQGARTAGPVVADFLGTLVSDPLSGYGPTRFRPPDGYRPPSVPLDPFAGNLVDDPSVWKVEEKDPAGEQPGQPADSLRQASGDS
jgi:penicillin-binding protein 1A